MGFIRIQGSREGISVEDIVRKISTDKKIRERTFSNLGDRTAYKMRAIISRRKRRPQASAEAKLEKVIDTEHFKLPDGIGWGVGNINILNQLAPYWKFVDTGISIRGMRIPGRGKMVTPGAFAPGTQEPSKKAIGQGRWHGIGYGWSFKAKRGIRRPLNYTALTNFWLKQQIAKMVAKKPIMVGGA